MEEIKREIEKREETLKELLEVNENIALCRTGTYPRVEIALASLAWGKLLEGQIELWELKREMMEEEAE